MKTVLVRYTTKDGQAGPNEGLVRDVFDELRSRSPGGFRYATYRQADGLTFVHLATLEDPEQNPLNGLPAFQAFQRGIQERCSAPPVVIELSAIDSYGLGVEG